MRLPRPPVPLTAAWWMGATPGAGSRLGLVRIAYAVFFLWYLAPIRLVTFVAHYPDPFRGQSWLSALVAPLVSATTLIVLEGTLIAGLTLLLVGLWTRLATGVVLVAGALVLAVLTDLDPEHGEILFVFVPVFVLLAGGRWGLTWSVDALLARRTRPTAVDPDDPDWRPLLPVRMTLVLLALLFGTSMVGKVRPGSLWMSDPLVMAHIARTRSLYADLVGKPVNPLASAIVGSPVLQQVGCWLVIALEGFFWLALFEGPLRRVVLGLGLLFHAFNALFLAVTFTQVLLGYLVVADWHRAVAPLRGRGPGIPRLPVPALIAGVLGAACGAAALWTTVDGLRAALRLGGVLDEMTIWIPVVPVALGLLLTGLRPAARRTSDTAAGEGPGAIRDRWRRAPR